MPDVPLLRVMSYGKRWGQKVNISIQFEADLLTLYLAPQTTNSHKKLLISGISVIR